MIVKNRSKVCLMISAATAFLLGYCFASSVRYFLSDVSKFVIFPPKKQKDVTLRDILFCDLENYFSH